MSENLKHTGLKKEVSEEIERYVVFRCTHKLGTGIKARIKSLECCWNSMFHGWICHPFKQLEIEKALKDAKVEFSVQILPMPKGIFSTDLGIANRWTRLDILENQVYEEDKNLLQVVYQYDNSLRPSDFANFPSDESKSIEQFQIEKDFHERWIELEKKKKDCEKIRKELTHLSSDPGEKIFDPKAPLVIAEALIKKHFLFGDSRTLHYCSDNAFWEWNGVKYMEFSEKQIRQIIYKFLQDAKKLTSEGFFENFNPNKSKVDQVVDALKAICYQNHCPSSGAVWLDGRKGPDPKYLISFQNGLLNVLEWLENPTIVLIPHTSQFLNVNSLDYPFNPDAPEPKEWLKFLNTIWPDDLESQQTLQEWFGYILTLDTKQHKIFLIVGPPRSGKGTIGRVLYELLGSFNAVGPTLSSLGGQFGLQPLLNKMLATISDARLNGRGNNSIIIERLLSISGEDPLTVDRKFMPSLTVSLPTRIMIMTNELPDMKDSSGALAKRYIILTLQKSWYGKEDTSLFEKLKIELPSILLWSLKGLKRLQEKGKFFQPSASISTIEELETMTSPVKAFIEERCETNPLKRIIISDLFFEWKNWCSTTGYTFSGNIQSFGKNLRAACPEIKIIRPQESNRERYYLGITTKFHEVSSADVRGQPWEDNY